MNLSETGKSCRTHICYGLMTICFFEDEGDRLFAPLTLTRPVDDLRIGIFTIREKWQRRLGTDSIARVRRVPLIYLFRRDLPDDDQDIIWINARWLPDKKAAEEVAELKTDQILQHGGRPVAARLDAEQSHDLFENGIARLHSETGADNRNTRKTESGTLLRYIWDIFANNEAEIRNDVELLDETATTRSAEYPHAILCNPDDIHIEPGARIDPGAVIDASTGPVFLGRDAHVMYGAVIQGPGALCERSVLKMGSKVYPGSTIGPVCKVSGEIHNVIMHSHSNKAHDGYLGNSLIGEWCNLGANTTTSNLKNNYKPIKIPEWENGHIYKSSLQFFGTVMGDHGKTAINTTLSAGTLCGVFCNIFTYGFPPKHVPSFSWVSPDGTEPYQFEKAMETAEIMMARRDIPLRKDYLMMMKHIFDHRDQMG